MGMKTVQITGVPAKNIFQYAPDIYKLPHDAQLEAKRLALQELVQKGIVRSDIPPEQPIPSIPEYIVQPSGTTPFGRQVCTYFLNDYTHPKPNKPKTQ